MTSLLPPALWVLKLQKALKKASGIFLDEKYYINVKHYLFMLNEKQCIGIKKMNQLTALYNNSQAE